MRRFFTHRFIPATVLVFIAALAFGATSTFSQLTIESYDAGTTCATATGAGDICAADAIEANGALDVGGAATITGAITLGAGLTLVDDADILLGTGSDFLITFDAAGQAPDSAVLGVGDESRQIHIMETADVGTDLTIAQQTNPSLLIHSADAGTATDYVLVTHDQTDGLISTGGGGLNFNAAGATYDITGDVTIDGAAGSLTFADGDETIVVKDNDATALDIGSSGMTNLIRLDTLTGTETVIVTGTNAADSFLVDVGTSQFDENVDVTGGVDITGALTVSTTSDLDGVISAGAGAGALTFDAASSSIVTTDDSGTGLLIGSTGMLGLITIDTTNSFEEVNIVGTTSTSSFKVDTGFATFDEQAVLTAGADCNDDMLLGGGAGAITFDAASASILTTDNVAAGLDIGSVGQLNLLRLDTQDDAEKVMITANAVDTTGFHVDQGKAVFDEAITVATPAFLYSKIRFCGNGMNGGDDHFMSPVPYDDTEADLASGAAGCDAEDAAAVGDADEIWPDMPNAAFKPVAMFCTGICTGATAANDTVTVALYDDTAAVTGMSCTFAFAGDATANQCSVVDTTPATVAAGSAIAVQVAGTDDVCSDAGDDFDCYLYVTF